MSEGNSTMEKSGGAYRRMDDGKTTNCSHYGGTWEHARKITAKQWRSVYNEMRTTYLACEKQDFEEKQRLQRHIANREQYIGVLQKKLVVQVDKWVQKAEQQVETNMINIVELALVNKALKAEQKKSAQLETVLRQWSHYENHRGIWVCRECEREIGHSLFCAIGLALGV